MGSDDPFPATGGRVDHTRGASRTDQTGHKTTLRSPSSAPNGYSAFVFKDRYGPMVKVELRVGDTVEWKRNGTPGSYKGTVVKIGKVPRIRLESHDGREIQPREVNAKVGFHRAWRNGHEIAFLP